MRRFLSALAALSVILFSSWTMAQMITPDDHDHREFISIGHVGAVVPMGDWDGDGFMVPALDSLARMMGARNNGWDVCIPQADANCYLYVSPIGAAGAITTHLMDGSLILTTEVGMDTLAGLYVWDGTQFRHAEQQVFGGGEQVDTASYGIKTVAANYYFDVVNTDFRAWSGREPTADALISDLQSGFVMGFNYYYDETDWNRIRGITAQADNQVTTLDGIVTSSVAYVYDGATLDMLRNGASQELLVTDVAVRPGEDAGRDLRKIEKTDVAVWNPAKTSTADIDDGAALVLGPYEILDWINICIYLENTDGADSFTDADVFVSPDNSLWIDVGWATCDTLGPGLGCYYCISANAYRYIRVLVTGNANPNEVSCDAWITANKG